MAEEIIDVEEIKEVGKQYMTFLCAGETYGISIDNISEIIGLQQITHIPETEDFIIGLINLRGKVIPVIDVRIRFGKEPAEYNDRTCVLVITVKETVIGLIVDRIREVVEIPDSQIMPPPSVSSLASQAKKYVFGIGRIGDEVKLLLNPDKLINENRDLDSEEEKDTEKETEEE